MNNWARVQIYVSEHSPPLAFRHRSLTVAVPIGGVSTLSRVTS